MGLVVLVGAPYEQIQTAQSGSISMVVKITYNCGNPLGLWIAILGLAMVVLGCSLGSKNQYGDEGRHP